MSKSTVSNADKLQYRRRVNTGADNGEHRWNVGQVWGERVERPYLNTDARPWRNADIWTVNGVEYEGYVQVEIDDRFPDDPYRLTLHISRSGVLGISEPTPAARDAIERAVLERAEEFFGAPTANERKMALEAEAASLASSALLALERRISQTYG
jgi:hypothetical protein